LSILPGFALVVLLLNAFSAAADGLVLKKDVELGGSAVAGKEGPLFLTAVCPVCNPVISTLRDGAHTFAPV